MAYKIINRHVILEPDLLPKAKYKRPMRQCNEATVGVKHELVEPRSRLDVTGCTFFYTTPNLWNKMAEKQATAPSIDSFKSYFKK